MLTNNSITFGKYQGKTLEHVLKDRGYCKWLKDQEWFREQYEYLYNRICEYVPRKYFVKDMEKHGSFLADYEFFNLRPLEKIKLPLSSSEKYSYEFYLKMIDELRARIYARMENDDDNPYNIKAPVNWLKRFESDYGIPRSEFKEFLGSYDLINIPYIVKRIKEEGGISYKGADSFLIAKAKSVDQEKWWEEVLKRRYGESLTVQHVYKKCIFDFLNIDTCTIFECKLGLKDFCEEQHRKYKIALEKYRIIYLISKNCVIDMEQQKVFTSNPKEYEEYLATVKNPSYLDDLIRANKFTIVRVEEIETLFGNP
tara:strand:- start:8726 stop:9661 length:936 start_codon:yes stop_codon:yes gene_type:complete